MTSQNLVYKTFELPCDKEHYAKPINLSGARTIKLTNKPANVEVWISTENTGQNLYPLKNRGDGWVNLDSPLYDCYVFTKGLNNTGENLILNYTGQKDFFEYGTSSVERIGNVQELYMLQNLSPNVIGQIAKAIQGIYYKPPIHTIAIQGEAKDYYDKSKNHYCVLPLGLNGIEKLKLDNNKYYKIEFNGHIDQLNDTLLDTSIITIAACSYHIAICNINNGATLTKYDNVEFENFYKANKRLWKSEISDLFDIFGAKNYAFWGNASSYSAGIFSPSSFNHIRNLILKGEIINKYTDFGLFFNIQELQNTTPEIHSSLLINIYELENAII